MKESFSLPPSAETIVSEQLETTNGIDIKKVTAKRTVEEKVLGIVLTIEGKAHFLDRNPANSDESIVGLLQHLSHAEIKINRHNQICVDGFVMTRLTTDWKVVEIPAAANAFYQAPEDFTPKENPLIDEGSIEKANWRLEMVYAAKKFFSGTIPQASVVVCLPGASDAEYMLWQNTCGATIDNMVFVEGDEIKAQNLTKQFVFSNKKPVVTVDWLGGLDKTFCSSLLQAIDGRSLSILSFDTESTFSGQLYADLVDTIRRSEVNDDFFVSLNFVSRAKKELCQRFLEVAGYRFRTEYPTTLETAREDLMRYLPEILQKDAQLFDYVAAVQNSGHYLGNGSVKMEYVYAGFSKRLKSS